jgi:hypothetical protein
MPVFTPEEKKIFDQEVESVKKGMLANKRALVSKYGKDAEKVIQGSAVKKALKKIENLRQNQEMEDTRLKEMVKMALTKPLDETNIQEDIDLGHKDNEPHDLKSQLYKIGKYAMELYQTMDQFEGKGEVDFPAWWQNKINTAGNMMSSAKHYLDFELKEPELGVDIQSVSNLNEKSLTAAEEKKKEEIVKAMKKDFKGPEAAMYAIATEKAKKVAEELAKKLKNK